MDIGEGNKVTAGFAKPSTTEAILTPTPLPPSVATGDTIGGVPGNCGSSIIRCFLAERAAQDTNDTATTYAQYEASGTGNGRRIVTVLIAGTWSGNGANANTPVLGFANFFLNTTYNGTSGPICATYIGPGNLTGATSGGTDGTKVYSSMLYQ